VAACFALLAFCGASCSWFVNPEKLALDSEPSGSAPKLANIIKIDPPTKTLPDTPAATQPSDKPISTNHRAILHWLMLIAVLLVLFLLSLILFHSLGRRLGKRSFRVHAPTRHADIWASHKPPQFFDP
jgi:hypothetical protein